jgi:hypothetical protein
MDAGKEDIEAIDEAQVEDTVKDDRAIPAEAEAMAGLAAVMAAPDADTTFTKRFKPAL